MLKICLTDPVLFYNANCNFCSDVAMLLKKITNMTVVANDDKTWFKNNHFKGKSNLMRAIQKDVHAVYFCYDEKRYPLFIKHNGLKSFYSVENIYTKGGAVAIAISRIRGLSFIKTVYDRDILFTRFVFSIIYNITKKIKILYNNI